MKKPHREGGTERKEINWEKGKTAGISDVIQFLERVKEKYGDLLLYIHNEEWIEYTVEGKPKNIQRDVLLRFTVSASNVEKTTPIPEIGSMAKMRGRGEEE